MYDIKITSKDKILDYLYISEQDALVNGVGFIKEDCNIVLMCDKKLEQNQIDRVVEIKKICYKNHDELYINDQYCYFIYPKQRRKKRCN
jgi:hypothetical protein